MGLLQNCITLSDLHKRPSTNTVQTISQNNTISQKKQKVHYSVFSMKPHLAYKYSKTQKRKSISV